METSQPKPSGRKLTIRLPDDQLQAVENQALSLSAKLGIRLYRHNVLSGVVGSFLGIAPTDPKSLAVSNHFRKTGGNR